MYQIKKIITLLFLVLISKNIYAQTIFFREEEDIWRLVLDSGDLCFPPQYDLKSVRSTGTYTSVRFEEKADDFAVSEIYVYLDAELYLGEVNKELERGFFEYVDAEEVGASTVRYYSGANTVGMDFVKSIIEFSPSVFLIIDQSPEKGGKLMIRKFLLGEYCELE